MAKVGNSQLRENSRWVRGIPIGIGSFGTVSIGFDRHDGRVFAVKSVPVTSAAAAQLDAIENEITLLRSLSSPFVVKYVADDTTVDSDLLRRNLHMEYLSGGTAADLAKSGADEELVRWYTWCLVSALQYVHSKGIVHCDVKGKNVLLCSSSGTAKLADFGSAKLAGDRRARMVPRGSPLWMAPEVVRGESQGCASDVWSLGCTLIEMITGAPAWRDDGADTLCRIGYSDELPEFPTRLSGLGLDFLEKCLRRDPARRWSSDELLRHPFLCMESTAQIKSFSSPRSVVEWPRLEVSDDEEGEEEVAWESDAGRRVVCDAPSAGERIGKLAGGGGANWESDGWVEVRGISCVGFSDNEEAGASSEYSESLGVKVEFQRAGGVELSGGGVVEESGSFSFTAVTKPSSVVEGDVIFVLGSILYCRSYQSCKGNEKNLPFSFSRFHHSNFSY